jgi:hypothetical protein
MLLAGNGDAKLEILLPKMQFELVLMHRSIPQFDDSFNN